MASETLDGKKQEDVANIEVKDEVKEDEKAEEEREEETKEEEERVEDTEMVEKEEATEEKGEEKEATEEKGDESKDQADESKKAKIGRKDTVKKVSKDEKRDQPSSKEAVTPSERPTRERKIVKRYSEPSPWSSSSKGLSIGKGRGTQLKDIPNVAFKLAKRKPDDNLQILHTILFGKKSKSHNLKRNIGQFSGYVWVENEEKHKAKIKEKLDKCVKEKLADFCHVFDISVKAIARKDKLSAKLLEFLQSPHATTDTLLSDKEQKGKKRKGKTTASSGKASEEVPAKKRKKTLQACVKRNHSSKNEEDAVDDKAEPSNSKNESEHANETENDSIQKEETEEKEIDKDEPIEKAALEMKSSKKNVNKDSGSKATSVKTPTKSPKKLSISSSKKGASNTEGASMPNAKVSANKKQKVEKGEKDQSDSTKEKRKNEKQSTSNGSTKDKGKRIASKKARPEPTKEELHAVVYDILSKSDLNTVTLSDIRRQLGTHFDVDLTDRKLEVTGIITDVINNMYDNDDEDESGDDADNGEEDNEEPSR